MAKRKEILFTVLIAFFSFLLCGCSLTNDRKACTLSYDDYLNIVETNNYDVSEYELSLESYPVKQIDAKKGKNFTASYQIFSSSQAVDDIYKNTKKYYSNENASSVWWNNIWRVCKSIFNEKKVRRGT